MEKEWCDLGCVKHIQMIELMVVLFLLMSFSRMVSMVLVLSHTLISHMLLALSTKRMSFTSRK